MTDPPIPLAADLAPGDARSRDLDWSGLRLVRVDAVDHPWFARAYDRLWREFGHRNEMETRDVIARRLADPLRRADDRTLHYQLLVVLAGDDLVAVRDHTAIASPDLASRPSVPGSSSPPSPDLSSRPSAPDSSSVVVHLSHVVVEPPHRGSGLAGWLRALPLQAARSVAAAVGLAAPRVTLVAEMEHPDGVTPDVMARLRSYGRAGFLMVDPTRAPYLQPDFRPPAEIDATGVQPVELALVLRRVGDEAATTLPGRELRDLVAALYTMYASVGTPHAHMAPLHARLAAFPPDHAAVPLRPPLP